jgi:hypothetical protein
MPVWFNRKSGEDTDSFNVTKSNGEENENGQ